LGFFAIQAVIAGMTAAGGGSIVNIGLDRVAHSVDAPSRIHCRESRNRRLDAHPVEAISEIQKRSVEALRVVQSTQIASLRATRDLAAAFAAPPLALWVACAKNMAETLVAPMRPLDVLPAQAAAAALPDVPRLVGSMRAPEASPDTAAEPELVTEAIAAAELEQAGDGLLPLLAEAPTTPVDSVESQILAPPVEVVAAAETLAAPEVHAVEHPLPQAPAPKTTGKKSKASTTANLRARSKRGPSK
jgi:hypothetical protein